MHGHDIVELKSTKKPQIKTLPPNADLPLTDVSTESNWK